MTKDKNIIHDSWITSKQIISFGQRFTAFAHVIHSSLGCFRFDSFPQLTEQRPNILLGDLIGISR